MLHRNLWGAVRPVVGMVHLPALPGSPGFHGSMTDLLDRALDDANVLVQGGLDGLLVENFGDAPFFPRRVPPETVAAMAVVVREILRSVTVPVGVNVLRNDAAAALGVAVASGASFIRVNVHSGVMFTDQGRLEGQAHRTLRLRAALRSPVLILADVMVKHATPPPGMALESAARDTWERGLADGLILTGPETGKPLDTDDLRRVRAALPPEAKIWVGSGTTPESAPRLLEMADGIIVGSSLEREGKAGGPVDPERVRAFSRALGRS